MSNPLATPVMGTTGGRVVPLSGAGISVNPPGRRAAQRFPSTAGPLDAASWRPATNSDARKLAHDRMELVDRLEAVERFDHLRHVETHVVVHEHVPKPRQAFELTDELDRKPRILAEIAHRLGVVLEAISPARRQLARDVDYELSAARI